MIVLKQRYIYRADLQANPQVLYLFGDTLEHRGAGVQAMEMRGEPNAIGITVKLKASMSADAFMYDETYEKNIKLITDDFQRINDYTLQGTEVIIIPVDGIGTEVAQMQYSCPRTLQFLNEKLDELKSIVRNR